ncbi:MAG TPA: phosphotransferase [Acidimicrobiia bacterium]|nr:phosphotransferase [Acidimicrobiia bacterium]
MIPVEVDELTPEWLSYAMDAEVTSVTVLDRHSGTTGRAHLALTGHPSIPATVFAKLAPFDAGQRKFVNLQGMGVAEARLYRDLAHELPVRVPKPWYAEFEGDGSSADDRYIMLLEDLEASGCRFPTREDPDIEARVFDIVEQLARLHARYWESPRFSSRGDLAWIAPRSTGSGDGGASMVRMAIDALADRLPAGFVELAELYEARSRDVLELYREGECTLVHGDPHLGNLFVDTINGDRTGFLDWAVIALAPGIRDVAYVLSASTPTQVRRDHEGALLLRYREILAAHGIVLDADTAWEQYRLFTIYGWCAATCTAAMGSKWQPEHIGLGGTERATIAALDLDSVGLLRQRLG